MVNKTDILKATLCKNLLYLKFIRSVASGYYQCEQVGGKNLNAYSKVVAISVLQLTGLKEISKHTVAVQTSAVIHLR